MVQFACPFCGVAISADGLTPATFLNCPSCARQVQVPPQSSYGSGYPQPQGQQDAYPQQGMQQPGHGATFSRDQRIASPPQPQGTMQPGMSQQPGMQQPQQGMPQYPQQGGMSRNVGAGYGNQSPAPQSQTVPQAASLPQAAASQQSAAGTQATQAETSSSVGDIGISVQTGRSRSTLLAIDKPSSGLKPWILGLLGMIAVLALAVIGIVLLQEDDQPPSRDTQLAAWVRSIRSAPTPELRMREINRLIDRGPDAVTDAMELTTDMDHDRATFSEEIVDGLSKLPESRVLSTLDAAITDSRPRVRVTAAMIAMRMGPRAKSLATRFAVAGRDKNQWVRWYALEAIAAMGPDASPVVGQLIILFEHRDHHTRRRAIEAVGKIGPLARIARPDLPDLLRSMISDSSNNQTVRGVAAETLRQIGG